MKERKRVFLYETPCSRSEQDTTNFNTKSYGKVVHRAYLY